MRQFALLVAVVVLVGCGKKPLFDPNNKDHVKIEAAVRKELKKPEGELTKVDLENVTWLNFSGYQLTDVSALTGSSS
jgi:predicted small lipoprotein YifL